MLGALIKGNICWNKRWDVLFECDWSQSCSLCCVMVKLIIGLLVNKCHHVRFWSWFWLFCEDYRRSFWSRSIYLSLQFSFWSCVASSCWATLQHFITMLKGHPNVKLNTHVQILFQVDVEQSDKTHRPLGPGYSYAAGCDVLPGKPRSALPCGDPRETLTHIRTITREPHPDPVRAEDKILEGDHSHQREEWEKIFLQIPTLSPRHPLSTRHTRFSCLWDRVCCTQ